MIKFIHKRHMHQDRKDNKIVIYYSVSDIFLGLALMVLVIFFINDYLSNPLRNSDDNASLDTSQKY